ncbi:arginine deiminase family protein [Streptomyces sp. NBC_01477]|uniref:arginine deiminase family protein n=1 Tax=Streptomyces sp. NBC_01477 TaxID=2976015 RepID=UPI002E371F0C|nr:arginine deiminase family protein [Streptomyces sp. NBC_01477]
MRSTEAITEPRAWGVHSEVGRLREAVVHRPGLELSRLTPGNCDALLFDDVLWAARAREEHDVFVQALRDRSVTVRHFDVLLAETLALPEARAFVLDRVCTAEQVGPTLAGPLRALADDADPGTLAELLIGGVTRTDLSPLQVRSLRWQSLGPDDFVLAPLPNTLFQRDNSAWIYDGRDGCASVPPRSVVACARPQLAARPPVAPGSAPTGSGPEARGRISSAPRNQSAANGRTGSPRAAEPGPASCDSAPRPMIGRGAQGSRGSRSGRVLSPLIPGCGPSSP